jgi:AAA domain
MSGDIDFTPYAEQIVHALLGERNKRLSKGAEWRFGTHGSLAVNLKLATWYDHEVGNGGGMLDLIKREKGLEKADAITWLRDDLHCDIDPPSKPSSKPNGRGSGPTSPKPLGDLVATYPYVDELGELLFQVLRYRDRATGAKSFRQRRPDGRGGWINSIMGVRRVPYKLPELIEALANYHVVFIVEGEKDVDAMWARSQPATCNPGGAGKWPGMRDDLNPIFTDADVVIVADNDPQAVNKAGELVFHDDGRPRFPGQDHAHEVAAELSGVAARVRVLDLGKYWKECPPKGDISDFFESGHTVDQLYEIVERLPDWTPEQQQQDSGDQQPTALTLNIWSAGADIEKPPPRGWLLGNAFCRRFLSSLFGDGGVGKTAIRYAQVLALTTGRELIGEHVFQRCRVLIVSLEDDADELRRRILAPRLHYGIGASEVDGWLFLSAPGGGAGKLMAADPHGRAVTGQLAAKLEAAIVAHKIDLLMLDPFVKTHAIAENLNSQMDGVAQILTDLATKYDVAIDAPHHISKGTPEPGNADRGRGASALKDACRIVSTATTMSPDEAEAFEIPEQERRLYVRVDPGKVNITRSAGAAKWFKLIGVRLDNGTELYPSGDEVQTVEPWKPPETWTDLSNDMLNQILDVFEAGIPGGNFYTDAPRASERAAWRVVQELAPFKSEAQSREIVRTWVANGVLVEFDYENPKTRKPVKGLRVNSAKRPGTDLFDLRH